MNVDVKLVLDLYAKKLLELEEQNIMLTAQVIEYEKLLKEKEVELNGETD